MTKGKDKGHSHAHASGHKDPEGSAPPAELNKQGLGQEENISTPLHAEGLEDDGLLDETASAGGASADFPVIEVPEAILAPEVILDRQAVELEQAKDQYLRLRADFDNFRKRQLRDKTELLDTATQDLMRELLPVLDHLQLGLKAAAERHSEPGFYDGMRLILDQLVGVLSRFGLAAIPTEHRPFDPNQCEAVGAIPSLEFPEGTVVAEARPGYRLKNRLLRPAQVIVSSGLPPDADRAAAEGNG